MRPGANGALPIAIRRGIRSPVRARVLFSGARRCDRPPAVRSDLDGRCEPCLPAAERCAGSVVDQCAADRRWFAAVAQMQVDPNVESSGLDPSLFGAVAQVPPRRLFQRGARSFQWQAEDRNGDTLEYAIYYRPLNETTFRLLKDNCATTSTRSTAQRWRMVVTSSRLSPLTRPTIRWARRCQESV